MKKIAVLGSTGSIGKQTLEVAAANPDKLQIKVLAAHVNDKLLEEQIEKFAPDMAVLTDEKAAQRLKERYTGKTKILAGREGLLEAVTYDGIDTVLASMVGYAGLLPTLEAIKHGKDIALANKETLVAAGSIVMAAVKQHNVSLTPVDSEHSAIFQSLQGGRKNEVKRLIITASGGPFLRKTKAELADVTLEQCLKHPNWSMGRKITVDSSTLANKGLEVIEAHWLFDMPYDNPPSRNDSSRQVYRRRHQMDRLSRFSEPRRNHRIATFPLVLCPQNEIKLPFGTRQHCHCHPYRRLFYPFGQLDEWRDSRQTE